jgi:hypothetical protein
MENKLMLFLHGEFKIEPPLPGNHLAYLDKFSRVRHMKRDVKLLEKLRDPLREAVGLPLGLDGAYYVAGEIPVDRDPTILNYNEPPLEQPGLWCFWAPTGNGESFAWRDVNKDYDYDTWLKYLIKYFFNPWNYKLSGKIDCCYYFSEFVYPNGEENEEVEIQYVEEAELIIKDDNIVIENDLGTSKCS